MHPNPNVIAGLDLPREDLGCDGIFELALNDPLERTRSELGIPA